MPCLVPQKDSNYAAFLIIFSVMVSLIVQPYSNSKKAMLAHLNFGTKGQKQPHPSIPPHFTLYYGSRKSWMHNALTLFLLSKTKAPKPKPLPFDFLFFFFLSKHSDHRPCFHSNLALAFRNFLSNSTVEEQYLATEARLNSIS